MIKLIEDLEFLLILFFLFEFLRQDPDSLELCLFLPLSSEAKIAGESHDTGRRLGVFTNRPLE